ncbi:hypothetical protein FSB75_00420 [Flavisolibacter ginsenosidimutans]|uniref:Carbohydrate-binding domain-containing protein n=2 Tax=Flavisolibacter ginsenosidimutans TaxID=661481 RepID=A0A5B8UP99_9BACT|nr:hypothetical protein FSB75_00420 [Flavisolibacter ginsenosidimutans]
MKEFTTNQKQLRVGFQRVINESDDLNAIANILRNAEKHPLSFAPWPGYTASADVAFSIAYGDKNLYLQYVVKESIVRAATGKINGPVYEDSCVEFFIRFDNDKAYYNFEFNCIGTVLAGFGPDRNNRELLSEHVLQNLRCHTVLQKENGAINWTLTVVLPFEAFAFHSLSSLHGKQGGANFYKCGDALPQPHYLAWSNIESESPNFHLPEFFGTLLFE